MTMNTMKKGRRARVGKARKMEDRRARAGRGQGRSQGEGAESGPGLRSNEFPLYCFGPLVGERVVGGEVSSAGHCQEARIWVYRRHGRKMA
jgi:hypothetical protein